MNKSIILIIALSLLGCNKKTQELTTGKQEITIVSIKTDLLDGYYCVFFKKGNNQSLLLSQKVNNVECVNTIHESDKISLNLEKIYKVKLDDLITWNLYANNFYQNGILVFKKDMDVFTSGCLNGLCIIK